MLNWPPNTLRVTSCDSSGPELQDARSFQNCTQLTAVCPVSSFIRCFKQKIRSKELRKVRCQNSLEAKLSNRMETVFEVKNAKFRQIDKTTDRVGRKQVELSSALNMQWLQSNGKSWQASKHLGDPCERLALHTNEAWTKNSFPAKLAGYASTR